MARKARVEFEGAVYHVLDRGDRREAIFRDDGDRQCFLRTLGETCGRTGWRIHAWVLMSNHYHLLVETPLANLVAGMGWFQTTFTIRFNRRHGLSGHLFQGRYKAVVVDPEEDGYFATLSDYLHLNPVRARIIGLDERLFDYRWSSYPCYAANLGRPSWFEPRRVLRGLNLEDSAEGRSAYAERMRQRAVAELMEPEPSARGELRRGWCLGEVSFRERMLGILDRAGARLRDRSPVDGVLRRSHGEGEARKILTRALEVVGFVAGDLSALKKGDPRKQAIAAIIRERTTVPNSWIARELHLGHPSRVSRCWKTDSPWVAALRAALEK